MCKDMYAWKDASCYHVASKHSISPRLQDLHLGPGRKVGFTSREEAMRAAEDALLGRQARGTPQAGRLPSGASADPDLPTRR